MTDRDKGWMCNRAENPIPEFRRKKQKAKQSSRAAWRTIADDKERYAAYLCSPEWSVLKEQVKKRSRGTCERCRIFPGEAVHHLTYARKYHEDLDDLQHTCAYCHAFIHAKASIDPGLCNRPAARFLHQCKISGRKPIPLMILVGVDDITRLSPPICEILTACKLLDVIHLDHAIKVLLDSLPFAVPRWFLTGQTAFAGESTQSAYHLLSLDPNGEPSWWLPLEDEEE